MFIYCICTQYLVGATFALITASIRRGMEVISLWHCLWCQILLENEISIFKKLVSRREHEVLQNFLVNGCSDLGFQKKHNGRPWAKEKKNWTVAQWSKVLFSDESKFCISFGNQGPRVWRMGGEAHSPSCMKSSVKVPQSVMIWGAMSSAGVGPLCFFENQRHCTRLPRNFGALHASFCWPAF